jgi:hypothetical protein
VKRQGCELRELPLRLRPNLILRRGRPPDYVLISPAGAAFTGKYGKIKRYRGDQLREENTFSR